MQLKNLKLHSIFMIVEFGQTGVRNDLAQLPERNWLVWHNAT